MPINPSDPLRRNSPPIDANPTVQPQPRPTSEASPTSQPADAVEGRFRPRVPRAGRAPGAAPSAPLDEARRIQEWRLGATAEALTRDLVRDLGNEHRALIDRAVRYPVHKLDRREVEALTNTPVSSRTRALVQRELRRVAVALRRRGDPALADVARRVADRMPPTIDALGIKMLWDLANRLPRAEDERIGAAQQQAPSLDNGSAELIREALFSFCHDGANTTGYRFYFSSTPPAADGTFTADHQIEIGLAPPDPSGTRRYHFVDDPPQLHDDQPYFIWATAFNAEGESGPSNVLHERFPAAARGDLNRDGVIDTADVDQLVRVLTGEDDALAVADVNADGWVTQADLQALLAKIQSP